MEKSNKLARTEHETVRDDGFVGEWREMGLAAMSSPFDPTPSLKTENGTIVEMDGKKRGEFDLIDIFIADYALDADAADKSMAIPSADIARMLCDINIDKNRISELARGLTAAKLAEVMNCMSVVEMLMAVQKMRGRASVINRARVKDGGPEAIAADAAEGALRGFGEIYTVVSDKPYAPITAMCALIGAQTGRSGTMTQCVADAAYELETGRLGFNSCTDSLRVFGTETAFADEAQTPYAQAFLTSVYGSRGIKARSTSEMGSELACGRSERKSMLYLAARRLLCAKGGGMCGVKSGFDGIASALPSGMLAAAAESLMAAMLGLEYLPSNSGEFSHSKTRGAAKTLIQLLSGADCVMSDCDAANNSDALDDYSVIQRDLNIDAGIRSVSDAQIRNVRERAADAVRAVLEYLGIETDDTGAVKCLPDEEISVIDIVRGLKNGGFDDIADAVTDVLRQRICGDYLQGFKEFGKEQNNTEQREDFKKLDFEIDPRKI